MVKIYMAKVIIFMKRRARYTNFILSSSTTKIFLECYVSREEAKEVWEK